MARGKIIKGAVRLGRFLFQRGEYHPAVTETNAAGQTVILAPEVTVPKGVLRSKTVVLAGIAGFFGFANGMGWHLWITAEQAQELFALISGGASVGAIVTRILAWMPTRGPTGRS